MLRFINQQLRQHRLRRERLPEPVTANISKLGGDRGWPTCLDFVTPKSVIYSFGVGANVAWDMAMIERTGATVHAFDPTPESIAWVAQQNFPPAFQFHDYGISNVDGFLHFFPPKKQGRFHYSQDRQKFNKDDAGVIRAPVFRLSTIMQRLGHTHIDVLKLDVEGSEFESIPDLLDSGISVGQLLLEIHYQHPTRSFDEGLSLIRRIQAAGFLCHTVSERGFEFGFVQRSLLAARRAA